MRQLVRRMISLGPALATLALGVWLVAAGLNGSFGATPASLAPVGTPAIETLPPTLSPTPVSPTASPSATATVAPSPTPSPTRSATATRVTVPDLGIDLPVIAGNTGFPLCDVAMYLSALGQPGQGRATYLFAHAREGMFFEIYRRAIVAGTGRTMLGMRAFVYTSDDFRFEYEIREVRVHQTDLDAATLATTEQLWLQTSEGPRGTPGKTQLVAYPIGVEPAHPAEARPTPKPVTCE